MELLEKFISGARVGRTRPLLTFMESSMAVRKIAKIKKGRRRRFVTCPECGGAGKTTQGQNLKLEIPASSMSQVKCGKCSGVGKIRDVPRDHIDALYDSLEKKDMTRIAFRRAYKRVTDENRAARDMNRIIRRQVLERQRKRDIDEQIERH